MGLPHRNSSVLKQAVPNKRQVKGRDPPSAVGGLKGIDTRVESWGKKSKKPMDCVPWVACFCRMRGKADPPSAVGGLKGIDTRVGSWGKNKKVKKKKEKQMRNYCFIDQLLPVPNK